MPTITVMNTGKDILHNLLSSDEDVHVRSRKYIVGSLKLDNMDFEVRRRFHPIIDELLKELRKRRRS